MSVRQLQRAMDTRELAEWMAVAQLDADKGFREDLDDKARAAVAARLAKRKRGAAA